MERKMNTLPRAVAAGVGVLLGLAALTGCAHYEHVDEALPATVTSHDFDPFHVVPVVVPRGKGGISVIPIVYPDKYSLELQQCDKPKAENVDERGCVIEKFTVTKNQYEEYKDGDTIILKH